MIIDVFVLLLLVMAIYKGYSKGFVIAVFSVIALVVGIAAAMKLSVVVANYLQDHASLSGKWLPVLSFLIVFVSVVLLVRLGANFIEKTLKLALMGWLNRIAGMLLYLFVYLLLLSVLLFYTQQLHLLDPETFQASKTWTYIRPLGPWAIEGLGMLIPWFRDMFAALQEFFANISRKV
jgi:membrane protein required for colicin V production